MPRAKLPRRLSDRDIERVEREVERTKARLRDTFARHWGAIARALGRDPSFLNCQADARDTVLHLVATYITTALKYRMKFTPGGSLVCVRRLRRLLKRHIAGQVVRERDLLRRQQLVDDCHTGRDGLDHITREALLATVRAFEDALRAGDVAAIAETARQLDAAAEQRAALLRRWPRKIEGRLEAVKTLCGLLGAFWDHCAADSVRASKARRREFVIAVLVAAEIRHPQSKRYQTLDDWIDLRP